MKCKFCNKSLNNLFLDLGKMPLANSNLKKTEIDETYPEFIQKNKEQYQEWILQ